MQVNNFWCIRGGSERYVFEISRMLTRRGRPARYPLKIAGSGMLETGARQLARELGAGNIEFTGFKSEEEVLRLVQDSRFICTPSEWYENVPMTVLEAFACGKPAVWLKPNTLTGNITIKS